MEQTVEIKQKYITKPSRSGLKYHLKTFGCQMNEHDSERIAGLFEQDGMVRATDEDTADVLFVNTCTIRENADDKLYGTLGQLKQWKLKKENRKLLVGGCAAQKDKSLVRDKAPWVDVVLGTHNLTNVINLLNQSEDWGPVTEIVDEIDEMPTEAPSIRESEFSAWLTIQIGCNNSCTFCIVPSVRGTEISRRPSDIINEAKSMIDSGVKEITLLGQNVNSYGRDLRIDNKARPYFAQLLYKLNELDGLERIRFTSPHPKDFKKETLEAVNDLEKVCKQVHVPLQSGSSKVLSKMQRGYTKEKFLEKIELVKNHPTNLIYNFDANEDQLLVFSEMYYPHGWSVKIDDQKAKIFPVNYVLRALRVPYGNHTIEFTFDPPVVRLGGSIRLVSLLIFILVVSCFGYQRFKKKIN